VVRGFFRAIGATVGGGCAPRVEDYPERKELSVPDVSLIVLADRYVALKAEIAAEFRQRQLASRFGSNGDAGYLDEGKRDARKAAADQLCAGVSYGTLEKVAWLMETFRNEERPLARKASRDALLAIEDGGAVAVPYQRAHATAVIEDLETRLADPEEDPLVLVLIEHKLKLLRNLQERRTPPGRLDSAARTVVRQIKDFRRYEASSGRPGDL